MKVVDKELFFGEIGYQPHSAAQWSYHRSNARFRVPVCGRRFGKALAIDTLIPTPTGWKSMAELRIGDQVFDETGKSCNVIQTSDIMYGRPCYEVLFSDGSRIIADAEHQWKSWDKPARKALTDIRRQSRPKLLTTEEMAQTLMYGKELNHAVQTTEPLQYDEKKQIINAYVLGAWLGDGTSANGGFTCFDPQIVSEIEAKGYVVREQKAQGHYGILGLHVQLAEVGVRGNKHIPIEYLHGSAEQRLELLQGLMDTDGSVGPNGQCEFSGMNKELVLGVKELALSLGCKVVYTTKRAKLNGHDVGEVYRLHITSSLPLFKLERKLYKQFHTYSGPQRGRWFRTVKAVKPIDSVPVKCIQVDSPSHLYLASQACIPTHNSDMAAKDLEPELLVPNRRFWIVGPTYDLGDKEFRVIWNDLIVKKGLGLDKRVRKAYNKKQGEMYIEFPWQTRIEVRSAQHPETLVGDSLHGVIMSEAAKHNRETWDRYIRSALADHRGWATFPTTPEGMNWLYVLWQMGRDPKFKGVYESWNFPSWENPIVYPGGYDDPEIQLLKQTMSVEEFLQEIAAQFTAFKGRIYGEFDENIHVQQHVYRPDWSNYITWDFGYRDALAAIEFQVDPWQNVYVWREHYGSFKTLETHIREMKNRDQPEGYKIDLMFGDAADPEAIAYLNEHYGATIGDPMSKTNWRQGIDLVKSFLKLRDIGLYDEFDRPIEKPSLWVDHACTNTIREFNNYKTKETPQGLRESNASGAAQRQDDHAMDALRYGLMHVFVLGATSHLEDITDMNELLSEAPEEGYFSLDGMQF